MTFVKAGNDFKMYSCTGFMTEKYQAYQYKYCKEVEGCKYCNIQNLINRSHKFIDPVYLMAGTFILLGEE